MKLTIASVLFTLLIISLSLNAGLITGHVRIGSPEKMQEMAYNDNQRALMNALVAENE